MSESQPKPIAQEHEDAARRMEQMVHKEAAMLEQGGKYKVDDEGAVAFMFSQKQVEEMEEKAREARVASYFKSLDEQISAARNAGNEDEARSVEERKKHDRFIVWDVKEEDGRSDIVLTEEAIEYAKGVLALENEKRDEEHEAIANIEWNPIDFKANAATALKALEAGKDYYQSKNLEWGVEQCLKPMPRNERKQIKGLSAPKTQAPASRVLDATGKFPSRGAKVALAATFEAISGEKIEGLESRIENILCAYSTQGELEAIAASFSEASGKEQTTAPKDLFEGYGTLIVKRNGERILIGKGFDHLSVGPSGRVIATRVHHDKHLDAIFDEDVYVAAYAHPHTGKGHLDTEDPQKIFYDGTAGSKEDDYDWVAFNNMGGEVPTDPEHPLYPVLLKRRDGFTYMDVGQKGVDDFYRLPKANVAYDKQHNTLVYFSDTIDLRRRDEEGEWVYGSESFNNYPLDVLPRGNPK